MYTESGKLVGGRLRSTRTRPSDSCTLACFCMKYACPKSDGAIQAVFAQSDLGLLWKNGTKSDVGSWIRPDSGFPNGGDCRTDFVLVMLMCFGRGVNDGLLELTTFITTCLYYM